MAIFSFILSNSELLSFISIAIIAFIMSILETNEDYKKCIELKTAENDEEMKKTLDAFGQFYKVVNGDYVPIKCEETALNTTVIEDPVWSAQATVGEPITLTFSGTIRGKVNDEVLFDLVAPVRCNCRNCGAPVRLNYCEYCGTQYPLDFQGRFKIGD